MDKINLDSATVKIKLAIVKELEINGDEVWFDERFVLTGKAKLDCSFSKIFGGMFMMLNHDFIKNELHYGLYVLLGNTIIPKKYSKPDCTMTCREVLEEVRKTKE